MARNPSEYEQPERRMRGFEPAFGLMKAPIRAASESRGFAVARLLTHWAEIVGEDMAASTRPVKVGYGREGFGATLTILVSGAVAPIIQMQKDSIRAKVNGIYGYNAISRINLTQTAPVGFAEGQAQFSTKPKSPPPTDPAIIARAQETAAPIQDQGLRSALELLAQNILKSRKSKEEDA